MPSLFTMQQNICGIHAIVASVCRGRYSSQRQQGSKDVHTTVKRCDKNVILSKNELQKLFD